MVGTTGVLALLLVTAEPSGPMLGAPDGLPHFDSQSAGYASVWTDEEFVPVPQEEVGQAQPAAYVDDYGREMARSMFQEPAPSEQDGSPFIPEKPEPLPPHLQPVPAPPPGGSMPEPPPLKPRDPAYGSELPTTPSTPTEPSAPEPKSPPTEPPPSIDQPFETWEEAPGGCSSCDDSGCGATCDAGCDVGGGMAGAGIHSWLWGIQYSAWLAQGATINTDSPGSGSNFPLGFNDESNAYQLNQFYVVLERPTGQNRCGWDIGGRVDLLYGTDHRFTMARGLETEGDFSPKWNSEFYGLSMPQLYAEVYAPILSGIHMKFGRFYTTIGYEVVTAPDNFFYSHTYSMLYGEPFTHTGFLGSTQWGPFTVHGGLTRGWDNWEDNNNDLGFLTGLSWTSADERTSIAFAVHGGREQDEPPPNTKLRNVFSLVAEHQLNPWCQWVVQYDHGFEPDGAQNGRRDARWHGLTQYLFYTINPHWKFGLRTEWFRDRDGARIDPVNIGGVDMFGVTAGLNYMPNDRVVVRPSFRWDWTTTDGRQPFIDFTRHDQITLDMDFIVKF